MLARGLRTYWVSSMFHEPIEQDNSKDTTSRDVILNQFYCKLCFLVLFFFSGNDVIENPDAFHYTQDININSYANNAIATLTSNQ